MPKFSWATRRLPTRDELDARNPRKRALVALGTLAGLVTLAASWWAKNGAELVDELVFRIDTIRVYWNLVATPEEKSTWTWVLVALLLAVLLGAILFHRFVWRAIFPDLVRLDPHGHPGGRPERVGRLFRTRRYQDGEHVRYRLYYKHGHRWFPLFRFDHVDLDTSAKPAHHGVSIIHCGRLDRDPAGNRFRRIASTESYGAAPLETTFREEEVVEDQHRKTSIVGPGPGMNPEVMRRKWAAEPSMTPVLEQRGRALLAQPQPPQEEAP
ncbi:MAG: hypothetical protein WDA16_06435 [Candidatus Thermoplasmatota archaeon]